MISGIIVSIINAYIILIFVYCIMSFIPTSTGIVGQIYSALSALCDPYLDLFRRFIPPLGMLDVSPVVAVIVLYVLERLIDFLL